MKGKRAKGFEDYQLIIRDRKAPEKVLLKNINYQQNMPQSASMRQLIVSFLSATK